MRHDEALGKGALSELKGGQYCGRGCPQQAQDIRFRFGSTGCRINLVSEVFVRIKA